MDNKDKQLSQIGEMELTAIEMKFDGHNYKEIWERLKIKYNEHAPEYQTIRAWLMNNGKLYHFYNDFVKEQSEIRKKEAITTFKAHLNTAVRVLVSIATNENAQESARVNACKEIINRELGEPLKRAQVEETNPAREILERAGLLTFNEEDEEEDEKTN